MPPVKLRSKKAIPQPGRKVSFEDALKRANKKFGKALAKLAK